MVSYNDSSIDWTIQEDEAHICGKAYSASDISNYLSKACLIYIRETDPKEK